MSRGLTTVEQLRSAMVEAKGLVAQVAAAAAGAVEELEGGKQEVLQGLPGQVAGFDEAGNLAAQELYADLGAASMEQVTAAIQAAILDSWEGSY